MHTNRLLYLLLLLLFTSPVFAQDEEAPVDSTAWQTSVTAILAGSQASYENWVEGGINSLAFTASINADANRTTESWITKHEGRFALGSLKQDDDDFRKADDLIFLSSTFQFKNDTNFAKWNPTASLTFRSQFVDGFEYTDSTQTKISALFSPAYLTQTLGFTYQPEEWFSWLIGVAAKETVVGIESLRPNFGNDLDESVRFESGFDSTMKLDRNIFENVNLKSTLGIFGAFNNLGEPDVRWENLVTMTVNTWLTVNFEFVTYYDQDLSSKVQLKQVLSTGVSFSLL